MVNKVYWDQGELKEVYRDQGGLKKVYLDQEELKRVYRGQGEYEPPPTPILNPEAAIGSYTVFC